MTAETAQAFEVVVKGADFGDRFAAAKRKRLAYLKPQRHSETLSFEALHRHKLIFRLATSTLDLGILQQSKTTDTFNSDWLATLLSIPRLASL